MVPRSRAEDPILCPDLDVLPAAQAGTDSMMSHTQYVLDMSFHPKLTISSSSSCCCCCVKAFLVFMDRPGSTLENTLIGSLAAAGACCVMIPVDTVKTRIVTQRPGTEKHYLGMVDCFIKILDTEGVGALYKALPPRLMAVVPMIGIQFGVYELVKRLLVEQPQPPKQRQSAVAVNKASSKQTHG